MTSLMSYKRFGALLALCILFLAPALRADTLTWNWSYNGSDYFGSGQLITSSTPDASGDYTVTFIDGNWSTATIPPVTSTITNLGGTNTLNGNDNLLTSTDSTVFQLDNKGLSFFTGSTEWNISYSGGKWYIAEGTNGHPTDLLGKFGATPLPSTAPVPEPSSIMLLGTALMMLGGLVWYRKQNATAITAA